jgi:hypothetical protein
MVHTYVIDTLTPFVYTFFRIQYCHEEFAHVWAFYLDLEAIKSYEHAMIPDSVSQIDTKSD